MADSRWRAGVIGTGFIGPAHVEALRRIGVEVVGLAGHGAERTAEKARQLYIPRSYGSAEELLADPDIQVVHVASPNHVHFAHARDALLAGKHVVCEKPLALNTRESGELVRLAQERGRANAVNFIYRYYPLTRQARALVSQGALGEVFSVQGSYLQDWLLRPTDWNWRLQPEIGGQMRALGDIGSHWIDLTCFITGLPVAAVFADLKTFLPVRKRPAQAVETFTGQLQSAVEYVDQPISTEDYATVLFRYAGGARGVMTVSQVSAGRKNRLSYEIDGAQAALAWDGENPNELWIGHRDRPNELLLKDPALLADEARPLAGYPGGHAEGFPDTFKNLYRSFYRYLDTGDFTAPAEFPTFADGHEGLRIGEAILRSAREERWVKIEEVGE